jgi:hypothetical protein
MNEWFHNYRSFIEQDQKGIIRKLSQKLTSPSKLQKDIYHCNSNQEPLKPRTNVSCRFLENQIAISFLAF